MSERRLDPENPAVAKAAAEASAWIALLHGARRTPAAEQGFRSWLAESELNQAIFETATDVWNQKRAAIRDAVQLRFAVPGWDKELTPPKQASLMLLGAAAALLLLVTGAWYYYAQRADVSTGIGERRILALEDGTQVSLNTATRLDVSYDKRERRVRLLAGEALFDVARRADRPFVVTAGDREITALGTAFLVRREAQRIAVTLVEGKVAVMQVGGGGSPAIGPVDGAAAASAITLSPGDRATFSSGTPTPRLDRPMIGRLTAWQQGRVQVDNLTLADAITEMNRYSALQLAVEGQDASRIRLSGTFKVGDSRAFAGAVAQTHGLEIREERHRIVLFGVPHEPDAAHFEPASPRPAVP